MKHTFAAILVLVVAEGCAVAGGQGTLVSPPPSTAPDVWCPSTPPPSYEPSGVTANNVAGDWIGVSQDPSGFRPVSTCDRTNYILRLSQTGEHLSGEVLQMDGYVYLFDMALLGPGTVAGTIREGRVKLVGEAEVYSASPGPQKQAVQYDVQFDEKSQLLVGYLNGKQIWLLPRLVQNPCPSPRPCDPVI